MKQIPFFSDFHVLLFLEVIPEVLDLQDDEVAREAIVSN